MTRESLRKGVIYGIAAYGMWGLIPVYFKAVSAVPALEVLAHRVTFGCIWVALAIFTVDQVHNAKRREMGGSSPKPSESPDGGGGSHL